MTISSINTNLAALVAQQNISTATTSTQQETAQLSSGNRIVEASNDVAALAVGTSLQSQVNTLNTSLTVASEGSSLLQVADGGLAQIQSILQRQQAIATQAQSGSLSTTQLGFLNEEFTNLTQEINQLAGSTNFNGVNLINGAISGNVNLSTNTGTVLTSSTAATSGTFMTISGTVAGGDTLTINGVTVTFSTYAAGTTQASGDVVISTANSGDTAANLAAFLNQSGDPQLAGLNFVATASTSTVSVNYTGGQLANNLTAIKVSTSDTTNITTSNITLASGGANGLGLDTSSAVGAVTGSLFVNSGLTAQTTGQAINLTNVENNSSFIGSFGSIGSITATYDTTGQVTLSFTAGGYTYNTTQANVTGQSGTVATLTFNGINTSNDTAGGGSFTLNLNGTVASALTIASQTDATNFATQLNQALSGVTVYQNRSVSSFTQPGIISTGSGNSTVQVGNLQGATLSAHLSNFTNANISSFTVSAPAVGSSDTDAVFTAVVNGQTYQSLSGIGNQIATNTILTLQDKQNPLNTLQLVTGNTGISSAGTTALNLSSASNAAAVQTALQQAVGLAGNTNASLTFQVGSSTSNTIGVSIGSATSSALFGGQSLDVLTQADAATASNALTTALNTVTSLRATVGALEERFNYASDAVQSASQNEGAAQSTLLDTDVAATSTSYATSQVQLQAGIAVLAQANQLPQNLLKLLA